MEMTTRTSKYAAKVRGDEQHHTVLYTVESPVVFGAVMQWTGSKRKPDLKDEADSSEGETELTHSTVPCTWPGRRHEGGPKQGEAS